MLYLSQSFSRRSMPTVAPNTPRDKSVGFAAAPVFVFSLGSLLVVVLRYVMRSQRTIRLPVFVGNQSMFQKEVYLLHTASISIPYEHSTRLGMILDTELAGGENCLVQEEYRVEVAMHGRAITRSYHHLPVFSSAMPYRAAVFSTSSHIRSWLFQYRGSGSPAADLLRSTKQAGRSRASMPVD